MGENIYKDRSTGSGPPIHFGDAGNTNDGYRNEGRDRGYESAARDYNSVARVLHENVGGPRH